MELRDIYFADHKCIRRPFIIVDKTTVNMITTRYIKDAETVEINGKTHYINPEVILLQELAHLEYYKSI